MSKTNFEKLVRWDADFYKSLSQGDCILCLTEQQVYLIGQITDSLRWFNTRWIGDKSGMDFNTIAEELEYRISERMSCGKLTQLAEQMNQLQITVNTRTNTVNNYIDPAADPEPTTADTPLDEAIPVAELAAHGTTIDGCDTDDKDALYSAINTVVRYIHQVNQQLLIDLGQSTGNIIEQSQTLLGAFPPTDLVAADDITKYINFLIDELKEEYDATVDEELLQATVCDLFCIAVSNGCNTNMYDISNYFGGKVDPTFANFAATYGNIVQFAFLGTFSGDMYFYYLCYFQLAGVAIGQGLGFETLRDYDLQLAAGQNSPDNDWTLFCTDCPEFHRLWTWDFARGMGEFEFEIIGAGADCDAGTVAGIYDGAAVKGIQCGSQNTLGVILPALDTWRIRSVKLYTRRENGIGNGTYDQSGFKVRVTAGTDTGSFNPISGGFRPNGEDIRCSVQNTTPPYYWTNGEEYVIRCGVSYDNDPVSAIYLDKVEILFVDNYDKLGSVAIEDDNLCT